MLLRLNISLLLSAFLAITSAFANPSDDDFKHPTNKNAGESGFEQLPYDIHHHILDFLPAESILKLSSVSRAAERITSEYKDHYARRFVVTIFGTAINPLPDQELDFVENLAQSIAFKVRLVASINEEFQKGRYLLCPELSLRESTLHFLQGCPGVEQRTLVDYINDHPGFAAEVLQAFAMLSETGDERLQRAALYHHLSQYKIISSEGELPDIPGVALVCAETCRISYAHHAPGQARLVSTEPLGVVVKREDLYDEDFRGQLNATFHHNPEHTLILDVNEDELNLEINAFLPRVRHLMLTSVGGELRHISALLCGHQSLESIKLSGLSSLEVMGDGLVAVNHNLKVFEAIGLPNLHTIGAGFLWANHQLENVVLTNIRNLRIVGQWFLRSCLKVSYINAKVLDALEAKGEKFMEATQLRVMGG